MSKIQIFKVALARIAKIRATKSTGQGVYLQDSKRHDDSRFRRYGSYHIQLLVRPDRLTHGQVVPVSLQLAVSISFPISEAPEGPEL